MDKVILIDIDGTVAHRVDREPYDYSRVLFDRPDHNVIDVATSLWKAGYKLIFISAREDYCFQDTYRWLTTHCPPFIKLFMRKSGDFRKDNIVKREIFDNNIKNVYDVLCVLDDRDQVVKMWRDLGLTCLQVADGNF